MEESSVLFRSWPAIRFNFFVSKFRGFEILVGGKHEWGRINDEIEFD